MAVLQGYTYGSINCEVCGTNYIMIESTNDPDVVRLSCYEAHSAEAPRDHPLIVQAIGVVQEAPAVADSATFRGSIPRPKVQLIFLAVAVLIALLDGLWWGVGAFLFLNFIAISYKMCPRFYTEA